MPAPRETFDRELQRLKDELLIMASLVEQNLIESVQILKAQNQHSAQALIKADAIVNQKRFAIEKDVLILIATQQPLAGDLRTLAAMLEIAGELERIGDYAKGIGKITLMIGDEPLIKPLIDIPRMANKARDMLHRSLTAFVEGNEELARSLAGEDDEVDALYVQIYRELMTYILEDTRNIEQANYLLWAAHNLERTADRVVNICERVVFTITGELGELATHFEVTDAPDF